MGILPAHHRPTSLRLGVSTVAATTTVNVVASTQFLNACVELVKKTCHHVGLLALGCSHLNLQILRRMIRLRFFIESKCFVSPNKYCTIVFAHSDKEHIIGCELDADHLTYMSMVELKKRLAWQMSRVGE